MVNALIESHRVLKPNGLLIDLRPAVMHRRVGTTAAEGYRLRWVMRETFEDDRAADRAVKEVIANGWFKAERRAMRFDCYRIMDRMGEFQEWLDDFVSRNELGSHDWLVKRLERALAAEGGKTRIVVSAPLILQVLRKQ